MVYLARKNGVVVHHTDVEAMMDLDGVVPEMEVTDEEFYAADGFARIINGVIFLGKTTEEIEDERKEIRKAEIDKELGDLDRISIRSARAVARAVGKGQTPSLTDMQMLDNYEDRIAALREERRTLI